MLLGRFSGDSPSHSRVRLTRTRKPYTVARMVHSSRGKDGLGPQNDIIVSGFEKAQRFLIP